MASESEEVEFQRVARRTTGRQEDEQLVALLALVTDGKPVALAMAPDAAIALGEELAEQKRRTLAAFGATTGA